MKCSAFSRSSFFSYFFIATSFISLLHAQELSKMATLKKNKLPLGFSIGDIDGRVQFKWKPETFYARNSNLFNNNNKSDQIFRNQSTIDTNINLAYGKQCFGHPASEFFVTLRNKNIWGNPRSILTTTESTIKLVDFVGGAHRHDITRLVPWIREIWMKFNIGDVFGLSFSHDHHFTLGSFPFELGRGISLGSAFGINPVALGFYSDNSIDQYAFGFKFSGSLHSTLTYDLYGEIVDNKGSTFNQTTEKVRGQEFGSKRNQVRGGGVVEYIVAGRLRWIPVTSEFLTASFEPYFLFLESPEQRVEFINDAEAKLGTFGLASEFVWDKFEWGFDTAINTGRQEVPGWDRNAVDLINVFDQANNGSRLEQVNSHVVTEDPATTKRPQKVPFIAGGPAQQAIDSAPQSASQNGKKIIGANEQDMFPLVVVGGTQLIPLWNDLTRFRDKRRNSLKGWMFVLDGAYSLIRRELKIAGGLGVASGDEDPNVNLDDPNASKPDNNFKGFVGLQELYTGSRIQSAFFLGGAGRPPRVLSTPTRVIDRLRITPTRINGFSNLIFGGTAIHWFPTIADRNLAIRPNAMFFWQQQATRKFDLTTGLSSKQPARTFYGTELNIFSDIALMPDFKLFCVGSIFIPGSHYSDIKGLPLDKDQQKIIDQPDKTGINFDRLPLLGTDVAYTLNIGIEIRI